MLRTINSGIYKNTEIFQQISDSQAAFVSGGMEIPISDVDELPLLLEQLNPVFDIVPIDLNSFVTLPSV